MCSWLLAPDSSSGLLVNLVDRGNQLQRHMGKPVLQRHTLATLQCPTARLRHQAGTLQQRVWHHRRRRRNSSPHPHHPHIRIRRKGRGWQRQPLLLVAVVVVRVAVQVVWVLYHQYRLLH